MYDNQLSTLPADLFDGLTALTTLYLQDNQLSALPDGLFDGLSALTTLYLYGNAVDPLPLTVLLEKVGTDQVKAVAPSGAPSGIVLPLTVANGDISGGATTITIPVGSLESQPLTVIRTPGTSAAVTVDIGTLPRPPANHSGYTLVKSTDLPLEMFSLLAGGICDRTPQVQTAILSAVPGASTCDEVTSAYLAAIRLLNVENKSINSLKAGDFAGLSALTTLNLVHNQLSSLPAGIFDDLNALTDLHLGRNRLSSLPAGVFDNLNALTTLNLSGNQLSSLPDGIFANLNALTRLYLADNRLSSLPDGIFANLNTLTGIDLGLNSVNPLPLTVSLEKVGEGQFKAIVPAGAPFDIVLPLTVVHGTITGGANSITIPAGRVESELLTVIRTPRHDLYCHRGHWQPTEAAHKPLRLCPRQVRRLAAGSHQRSREHRARVYRRHEHHPLNRGEYRVRRQHRHGHSRHGMRKTTRLPTPSGRPGTDAAAFSIDSTTGQLQTRAALDYETKSSYSVVHHRLRWNADGHHNRRDQHHRHRRGA